MVAFSAYCSYVWGQKMKKSLWDRLAVCSRTRDGRCLATARWIRFRGNNYATIVLMDAVFSMRSVSFEICSERKADDRICPRGLQSIFTA
jgi:hypothetical protein